MQPPAKRPSGFRRCAIAVVPALLSGCTTFGSPSGRHRELATDVAPAVVAWTLGALCRDRHPGADAWPGSPGAPVPVVRDADGDLWIALGGPHDGPMRAATNGRLAGPRLRAEGPGGPVLVPGEFLPADRTTGFAGPTAIRIRVTPTTDGGAQVDLRIGEAAGHDALLERLETAVGVLDAIQYCGRLLREDRSGEAHRRAQAAVEALRARAITGLGELEAALHALAAVGAEREGHLIAARVSLSSAISLASDTGPLLAARAALDQRLARGDDARRSLALLAAGAGTSDSALRATEGLLAGIRAARWAAPTELAAATAERLLADGDTTGAMSWARSARALGGDLPRISRLDALARFQGEPRSALAVGLARLERRGFDRDLVVAVCEDAFTIDDVPTVLRVIAARWEPLHAVDARTAEELLERAVVAVGANHAARVLCSARNPALAQRALAAWTGASDATTAGQTLLARLPALRALHAATRPEPFPDRDHWNLAPGVAPLR